MHDKIESIKRIYQQLDNNILEFQSKTGLNCVNNCTLCCQKREIQTSVLEMLPLAWHLHTHHLHEQVITEIDNNPEFCIGLTGNKERQFSGCRFYPFRGLTCRLFGFSVTKIKSEKLSLYTCKIIKDLYADRIPEITRLVNNGMDAPLPSRYYYELYFIDEKLARDFNPINQSLYKALMITGYYFMETLDTELIAENPQDYMPEAILN